MTTKIPPKVGVETWDMETTLRYGWYVY